MIKGEGEVIVTRNAFLASIETDGGWSMEGQQVSLLVSTSLPDGKPLSIPGRVIVEEVSYIADNAMVAAEKKVDELKAHTHDQGPVRISWRAPHTGQFKFTFVAKDDWGGEVKASTVLWLSLIHI